MGVTDHSPRTGIKVEPSPGKRKGNLTKRPVAPPRKKATGGFIAKGGVAAAVIAVISVIAILMSQSTSVVLAADVLVGQENGAVPGKSGGVGRYSAVAADMDTSDITAEGESNPAVNVKPETTDDTSGDPADTPDENQDDGADGTQTGDSGNVTDGADDDPAGDNVETGLTSSGKPDGTSGAGAAGGAGGAGAASGASEASEARYTVVFEFYGRNSVSCTTESATIGEIAEKLGIVFDENEVLNVDTNMLVTEDTVVSADMVTYGTISVSEPVDYGVTYVDSQTIPLGTTSLISEGIEGEKVTEYACTYVNGKEVLRTPGESQITRQPVDRVMGRGVGGTFVGGDGKTYSYSYYIDVKATMYWAGGSTASGRPADENAIAVDPRVIPLGTQVYITGSYADIGVRVAADTGSAIKGNIIDICFDRSNPIAPAFGVRYMRMYILN